MMMMMMMTIINIIIIIIIIICFIIIIIIIIVMILLLILLLLLAGMRQLLSSRVIGRVWSTLELLRAICARRVVESLGCVSQAHAMQPCMTTRFSPICIAWCGATWHDVARRVVSCHVEAWRGAVLRCVASFWLVLVWYGLRIV